MKGGKARIVSFLAIAVTFAILIAVLSSIGLQIKTSSIATIERLGRSAESQSRAIGDTGQAIVKTLCNWIRGDCPRSLLVPKSPALTNKE
jgi:hypothetical protein